MSHRHAVPDDGRQQHNHNPTHMNWYIVWNDNSTSVWSASDWTASQILALTNVRDVVLR